MHALLSRLWSAGIVGTFLAGLFVILPVALTVIVLDWMIGKIANVLGPGSLVGDLLLSGGGTIVGPNHSTLAYFIGSIVAVSAIWLIGLLVKTKAKQEIDRGVDRLFETLPVVRSVYKPIAQVVRLFSGDRRREFDTMSVVMCRFGGTDGADILALLTTSEVYVVNEERRKLVYLPTSPLPMSGGLVFVPEKSVVPVPGMNVDDLMKIYFSLGVLAPELASGSLATADRPHDRNEVPLDPAGKG